MNFLKLPTIQGTVTSKRHVGWIPVESIGFGGPQRSDPGVAARMFRFSDVSISRRIDRSSTAIMAAAIEGKRFPEAKLELSFARGKEREAYLFSFTDAFLVSFSVAGDGKDPRETFALDFNDMRVKLVQ